MTIAIEPMVNMGRAQVRQLADGWTVVTADGKPSAHFEHTVLITEDEPEILTCLPERAGCGQELSRGEIPAFRCRDFRPRSSCRAATKSAPGGRRRGPEAGAYRVELANGHRCIARASGELRLNFIRPVLNDLVHLEFNPYDLSRGRIVLPAEAPANSKSLKKAGESG